AQLSSPPRAPRALSPLPVGRPLRSSFRAPGLAMSQLAWARLKAVGATPLPPPFCSPQVEQLDPSSPFASKANVVAYDRHVLFTSDDPTGATRHRASCLISMTRIEEAFVHEMPEELVGLVFAQADLVAYACDLGVGVYLIPSALALVDSPEHRSALVVGKLCGHYAPLPLVSLPPVRLPDRTVTCPRRCLPRGPKAGHTIDITMGPWVHVPNRAIVWRTGPVTGPYVRGAACCRRRARSGSTAGAPRRGGKARAGEH